MSTFWNAYAHRVVFVLSLFSSKILCWFFHYNRMISFVILNKFDCSSFCQPAFWSLITIWMFNLNGWLVFKMNKILSCKSLSYVYFKSNLNDKAYLIATQYLHLNNVSELTKLFGFHVVWSEVWQLPWYGKVVYVIVPFSFGTQ